MSGQGRYLYPNGDTYEGAFRNGKFEGQGRYTFASGDPPLVGPFLDGKLVADWSLPSA